MKVTWSPMSFLTIRRILIGLTLGVLLALVIAPQTRWLIQAQALSLFHIPPVPALFPQAESAARVKAVAARYPNDYQLQYSAALWSGHWPYTDALRTLDARFPGSASLRANILRYDCVQLHPYRDENYLFEELPVPPPSQHSSPAAPAMVATFDLDAAAGERLDPDNAYFPFMHAIGLYAAHRDAEARAAILRAGTESRWDEYIQDEVEGRWRLNALVFGGSTNNALSRSAVAAAELFPHYASLRAVARVATYQAIEEEQTGDFSGGIALRRALMHCGGLMRAQSSTLICAFVGIAIAHVAMSRPDGAPRARSPQTTSDEARRQFQAARVAAFADYLRRHGNALGAAQAVAEAQADQEGLAISQADLDLFTPYGGALGHVAYWGMASLLILTNALWLLLCGGLAWLLGRFPTPRRPVFVAGRLLLLCVAGALAWWTTQGIREYVLLVNSLIGNGTLSSLLPWIVTLAALATPLLVILGGLIRLRRAPVRQTVGATAVPFACLVLLVYASVVFTTARQERVANEALTQTLHGEGQYFAARGGQSWPGMVD